MNRVGIDCLSVFGLPPVEFVNLAADLGCNYISVGLDPVGPNLSKSASWTLRDPGLRREMINAMRDRNVSIALGEGLVILPDRAVSEYRSDLDAMAELGIRRICTLSVDPDMQRSLDQIAALVEQAARVGIESVIEFVPIFTISNLPEAVSAVRHIGNGKVKILVDCMHLFRSGGSANDLMALDSEMIGYVQLCDIPQVPVIGDYMEEAMHERMIPGSGELPLLDILSAVPRDVMLGLEIPMRSRIEAGEEAKSRLLPCVTAAQNLVGQLG